MRIISGAAKGRRLATPDGVAIRPSADRVKEAIFSIVNFDILGSVALDLFSGSGQLGIEALSRGAKFCAFVDNSPTAITLTRKNIETAGFVGNFDIISQDYSAFLKNTTLNFNLAFVDPPYGADLYYKSLSMLSPKMLDGGKVICEHGRDLELPANVGQLAKHKSYFYGKTAVTIYLR